MEFVAERKLAFEYVAYNRTGGQVAVRMLKGSKHAVVIAHWGWCRRSGVLNSQLCNRRRQKS